jgi:colicin import membrane protein
MTSNSILAPITRLALPNSDELGGKAKQQLAFVMAFEITSHDDYLLAADELIALKSKAKVLEDKRTGITAPINAALRAINDLFRVPAQLLANAEIVLKQKMLAYEQEQARIAAEAKRKAEEAAAAERKRLEEEAAARAREAEEQAKAAAAAKVSGDEQAASLAQAQMQRAQAEAHAAEINAQLVIALPDVTIEPPRAKGISTSKKLEHEVESMAKLLAFIVTGNGETPLTHPDLIGLVKPDDVRLRAYVKGIGLACSLPGVMVREQKVMSAKAGGVLK